MSDDATNPEHYQCSDSQYEPIKVIEAWGLGFCLGNVLKYISRAGKKGDRIEDLKKARWYLDREISRSEQSSAKDRAKDNDGWIEHDGSDKFKCPVDPETLVIIKMDGYGDYFEYLPAKEWHWGPVTHYKIKP